MAKLTRKFINEINRQLQIAPPKVICTSGKIQIVKPTIAAFTRTVKSPSVRKINGNEIIVAIGLITVLITEKIKPAAT